MAKHELQIELYDFALKTWLSRKTKNGADYWIKIILLHCHNIGNEI